METNSVADEFDRRLLLAQEFDFATILAEESRKDDVDHLISAYIDAGMGLAISDDDWPHVTKYLEATYPTNKHGLALGTAGRKGLIRWDVARIEKLNSRASAEVGAPSYDAITNAVRAGMPTRSAREAFITYLTINAMCLCKPRKITLVYTDEDGVRREYTRLRNVEQYSGPMSGVSGNRSIWGRETLHNDRTVAGPAARQAMGEGGGYYRHSHYDWMWREMVKAIKGQDGREGIRLPRDMREAVQHIKMPNRRSLLICRESPNLLDDSDFATMMESSTDHTRGPIMMSRYYKQRRELVYFTPSRSVRSGDRWAKAESQVLNTTTVAGRWTRDNSVELRCPELSVVMHFPDILKGLDYRVNWNRTGNVVATNFGGGSEPSEPDPKPDPKPDNSKIDEHLEQIESDAKDIQTHANSRSIERRAKRIQRRVAEIRRLRALQGA